MAKDQGIMSINRACQLLGHSKQAWHKSQRNQARKTAERAEEAERVLEKVAEIRRDMPRLGTRKLKHLLAGAEVPVGRDALFDLLRERGKLVKPRKKRPKTTDSSQWMRQFDNLAEGRVPEKPEEVLVSDITFFRTREEGFVHGHLVTDAYSKKLLGHEVSTDMTAKSTLKALKMALENRRYKHPFIHHSDRGSQYLAKIYTQTVETNAGKMSTTQDGSPYDNAVAERINGILKDEFGLGQTLENIHDARQKMKQAEHLYNHKRPYGSCHMLTPEQMHQQQTLSVKTYRRKNIEKPVNSKP